MSILFRGPSIDATYQVSVHLAMRCQRRRFFRNQPIRNKNCLWQPCLLTDREEMSNLCRGSSIDVSYKVLAHLTKHFKRRRPLRNQPIRNKNCLWQPCLLTDRDEMSNLYRGPTIDASYQVAVHLAKQFQRRRFFQKSNNQRKELPVAAMFVDVSEQNEQSLQRTFQGCFLLNFSSFGKAVSEEIFIRKQPIRNKNCLWRPCLLMYRNEMSNPYREPSKDTSYKISIHLAKRFQRKKSTNQKQELPVATMFVSGSDRNEQSFQRTFHRCFLTNFGSFGQAVSDEKIIQKSTNQKQELFVVAMFVNGLGGNKQSVNGSGQNVQSLERSFHRCFLPSFISFS